MTASKSAKSHNLTRVVLLARTNQSSRSLMTMHKLAANATSSKRISLAVTRPTSTFNFGAKKKSASKAPKTENVDKNDKVKSEQKNETKTEQS